MGSRWDFGFSGANMRPRLDESPPPMMELTSTTAGSASRIFAT
jgi:hypothetical protein